MSDMTQILDLADPALDAAAMAQRIQANLRAHGLEPRDFPEFPVTPPPWRADSRFPESLHYDLAHAAQAYGETWVTLPPLASRVPLVARIKRAFHRLALYYVNLLAGKQMIVNAAILRALNRLVVTLATPDAEVAALREEVAALRARVADLEAVLPSSDDQRSREHPAPSSQ